MRAVNTETSIRQIVRSAVEAYSNGFETRHIAEVDNPDGTINMKIHNVFIAALGEEIQYYTSLVRSLDSSMGNMLEHMAINIAKLFYEVEKSVEGKLYPEQTAKIAEFLEGYKNSKNNLKPLISHYEEIKNTKSSSNVITKTHISDYYLYDKQTDTHHLIELKIGGDLDNKKAGNEGEAISLVCIDEHDYLFGIEKLIKQKIRKIETIGFKVDPNIKAEPIGNRSNRGNSSNQNRTAKPKDANSSSKRSFGKKRVEDSSSSSAKPRGFASKNRRTNSGFKKITN